MAKNKKAQLEITADATGALKTMADVGSAADAMSQKVVGAGQGAGKGLDAIGASGEKAAEKLSRVERSIVNSIQRSTAELKTLGQGSAARFEAMASLRGIDSAKIAPYLASLRAAEQQAEALAKANAKTGLSAKEMAFAMRGIPAQFTDIATSLASGQRPLTVLLQQGGQLKDMFGGIGPAARAMGGYVAGLVNPFTVAAVAVGGLTAAWYQGSKEAQEYQRAIILTGNAVGATAAQLNGMAEKVAAASGGTQGLAAEAIAGLAGTGKIAAENIALVAEAATRMQTAAGIPIAETIKQFEELGREPVKASEKLNDQANYLTESLYRQIKALAEHGKTTEAAALAQTTWANAINNRAPEIVKSLGYIERGWKHVSEQAAKAWDFMKGLGRDDSDPLATARATLLKKRQDAASMYNYDPYGRAGRSAEVAQAERIVKQLEAEGKARAEAAAQTARQNEQNKAGIALAEERDKYLTREEQKRRELARLEEIYNKSAKTDKNRDDYLASVAAVNEKYAEKVKAATKSAKAAVDEFAAVMNRISAKDTGVDASFWKDLQALHAGYQAGRVDADAYADAVRNLTNQQGFAKAAAKAAAEAEESIWKAREKAREEAQRGLATLQGEIEQQQRHNEEIGLTTEAMAQLEQHRLDDAIATQEQAFAQAQKEGADMVELKLIDDKIAALRDLKSLKAEGAARQVVADEAKRAADDWKKFTDDIERSLTDSLMRSFESGENFGKTFVKSLQNTLKTTVLKVAVQAVVGDVMGAVGLGSGAGSNGSSIGSMLSMGSNLSSLAGGGSILGGFGAGFSSMAGEMAMGANFVGPSVSLASGSVGAGAATASAMGSTAAGMMSSVAAAAPYALAALAVADAVGAFGKRGGPQQGQYSQTTRDSFNVGHTSSGGAPLDSKALALAVLGQVDMLYSMAGRQKANVMIDQGYGFDPQGTSPDMKYRKINIEGKQLTSFDDRSVRGDTEGAAKRLANLTSTEIEAIAKAIDSPKLNETIQNLKNNFGDLEKAMAAYGKAQMTQQAILAATQSDEEAQRNTANSLFAAVGGAFNALNITMPDSVAGIHALVEGLDLTTKSGMDTLNSLTALGPAFDQYIAAAKKVEADRREWQDKLDVLNGKTTEQELERAKTLASVSDETTKSLMRQVFAMQDQASAAKEASSALENAAASARAVAAKQRDLDIQLMEARGDVQGATAAKRSDTLAGLENDSLRATQQQIWDALDAAQIESQRKSMQVQLLQAQGDTAGAEALQRQYALADIGDAGLKSLQQQIYAAQDLARQQEEARRATEESARAAQQAAEAQARAQQQIRDEWQRTADSIFDTIRKLRGDVASPAQSYAAAQAQFSIATASARAGDQGAAGQLPQLAQSVVDLGKAIAVTRVDQQLLTARTIASLSATMEGMRQFGIEIPAFASGGYHAGGLRLVGENGPELEATGSARIYSFDQTRDMLTGGNDMRGMRQELIALRRELAALRADNSAENRAIASHTAKTAMRIDAAMPDGDALAVRTAA